MRLLAHIDPVYRKEPVEYVLNFISSCLGIKITRVVDEESYADDDVILVYSATIPSKLSSCKLVIHIHPSDFFTEELYLKRKSMPVGLKYSNGLPWFLFHGQQSVSAEGFPDVFATIFFLLTAYEELIECGTRDKRQRRNFTSSIFSQHPILHSPVIDQWLALLQRFITQRSGVKFESLTWQGSEFAFVVTRDIDTLSKLRDFRWGAFLKSITQGNPVQYLSSVNTRLYKRQDSHNNLEEIINWERQHNIRSSNYFIASEEAGDANYAIEQVAKREVISVMKAEGWEIGFHPGANAFQDRERFAMEKSRLEKAFQIHVQGGRQHGLRFNNPQTWRLWEENNLAYDSTAGFAEHEGFKAGTCRPFFIFDLLENKRLNLLEIPITLMDCTLDKYRQLTYEQMEEVCQQLLSTVQQFHGVFMLLWHNSYFGKDNIGNYHDILVRLVKKAQNEQALVTTTNHINSLWRARLQRLNLS